MLSARDRGPGEADARDDAAVATPAKSASEPVFGEAHALERRDVEIAKTGRQSLARQAARSVHRCAQPRVPATSTKRLM